MVLQHWLRNLFSPRATCTQQTPRWIKNITQKSRRQHMKSAWAKTEDLESRVMLSSITVNSLADNTTFGDGFVTLREAIIAANTDDITELGDFGDGADTIQFDASLSGGTITLGSQLDISSDITIQGLGADQLTVSGNDATRVFEITTGNHEVTIDSLTIADGLVDTLSSESGAGILNQSTGALSVTSTILSGNSVFVLGQSGGAIHHTSGQLYIHNSTLSENYAPTGGALAIAPGASASITNSTFSNNEGGGSTGGGGGAIYSEGDVTITNATVTGNTSTEGGSAGGIERVAGTMTIENSIVSGNLEDSLASDVGGNPTITDSLIGGDTSAILDPVLNDNGGPTPTHALVAGSPAINMGSNTAATNAGLTTDQRGTGFNRTLGGTVDIGAFEATVLPEVNLSLSPTFGEEAFGTTITATATTDTAVVGNQTVDVNVLLAGGIAADDFDVISGVITILDGETTGTAYFVIQDDAEVEGSETATIAISNPSSGLTLGAATQDTVLIVDNEADISVTIDNGQTTAIPGDSVTYTIEVVNSGLDGTAHSFSILSTLPSSLSEVSILSITPSGGTSGITDNSSGNELDISVFDMPEDGRIVVTVMATIDPNATGSLNVTASVPYSSDPFTDNNSATDTTDLMPVEAPSLVVTTDDDVVDKTDFLTSLREAIAFANLTSDTLDDITFGDGSSLTGGTDFTDYTGDTITLNGTQLDIASDITITGSGTDLLTISGDNSSRVFDIANGDHDVTIGALTVTGGRVSNSPGAGIRNRSAGSFTLQNIVLTDNRVSHSNGGGLHHSNGQLMIIDATISSNNTIVSGGSDGGDGAGIFIQSGTATIDGSTISENTAHISGGGIGNRGDLTITNSTISGNLASQNFNGDPGRGGAGIDQFGTATLTINNSTITTNSTVNSLLVGNGSGIRRRGGTVEINNSIVAGNLGSSDLSGEDFTTNNSLIGTPNGLTINDILDTNLTNNGGPTLTHALVPGSPAVNAGDNSLAVDADDNPLSTDQRGTGFERILDGTVDIGAVELSVDFGDAPDSYGTTLGSNGPVHTINPTAGPFLGSGVDSELDGIPSNNAQGDDLDDGTDDEDGVTFDSPLIPGEQASITMTAGPVGGLLDAWVDYDGDGTFGTGDQILTSFPLTPGANSLNIDVPENAILGETFARFRFSTAGGLAPTGPALDGEVEDYAVAIVAPPAIEVTQADILLIDGGQPGVVNPGDTVRYTVVVTNTGEADATGVIFTNPAIANTSLVVGSVTTSQGSVTTGNTAGDTSSAIDLGTVAGSGSVTITFDVVIDNPLPAGITEIVSQGLVAGDNFTDEPSDDPDTAVADDPTLTSIVVEDEEECIDNLGLLEDTTRVAGNVNAYAIGGNLTLLGSFADNSLEITTAENGDIIISGLAGTTINGMTEFVAFAGTGAITGNIFGSFSGSTYLCVNKVNVIGGMTVMTGSGTDAIEMNDVSIGFALNLNTYLGESHIAFEEVEITNHTQIVGSIGDDTVNVEGSKFGSFVKILSSGGDDAARIANSQIDGVFTTTLSSGNNVIDLDNSVFNGHVTAVTPAGSIALRLRDNTFNSTAFLVGGVSTNDTLMDNGTNTFAFTPFSTGFENFSNSLIDEEFEDLFGLAF